MLCHSMNWQKRYLEEKPEHEIIGTGKRQQFDRYTFLMDNNERACLLFYPALSVFLCVKFGRLIGLIKSSICTLPRSEVMGICGDWLGYGMGRRKLLMTAHDGRTLLLLFFSTYPQQREERISLHCLHCGIAIPRKCTYSTTTSQVL